MTTSSASTSSARDQSPVLRIDEQLAGHVEEIEILRGPIRSSDASMWFTLFGSEIDWGYTSVPQQALGGRVTYEPRVGFFRATLVWSIVLAALLGTVALRTLAARPAVGDS